jgi:hypothetical protein
VQLGEILAHVAAAELQNQMHVRVIEDHIVKEDDVVMSQGSEEGRLSEDGHGHALRRVIASLHALDGDEPSAGHIACNDDVSMGSLFHTDEH